MIKTLFTILLLTYISSTLANEFDICEGITIDDVTEKAYGQHGILFTGEAVCYWDEEKTILKYKRSYQNGNPVGRHICYEQDGIAKYSISYNLSKLKSYSFNYSDEHFKNIISSIKTDCITDKEGSCWQDRACGFNNPECIFTCNEKI